MKELDPSKKADDQLNFSSKGKSVKSKSHIMMKHMSLEDLKNTDLLDAIRNIHNKLDSGND